MRPSRDLNGLKRMIRPQQRRLMPVHIGAPVVIPGLRYGDQRRFGAPDGPAHLIFLIAAPTEGDADHMTILAALARRLVHASFREALSTAADPQQVAELITRE